MSKLSKDESCVRIIGGQWRSRKLIFLGEKDLRPTHDRIRETLFNWLKDIIKNSVCLDTFAGSGALGFEALSRGAVHVTFIDTSSNVIKYLKQNALALKTNQADFIQSDFMLENAVENKKFNVVFLDPPFQKNYLIAVLELLITRHLLSDDAYIYAEFERGSVDLKKIPAWLAIKKHEKTKKIEYMLCAVTNHDR